MGSVLTVCVCTCNKLQSRLLALTLVDRESQTLCLWAQPHRPSVRDKNGLAVVVLLMSAGCSQVFLAVCGPVEFLSSLPYPARAGRGDRQLCPSCTPCRLSTSACPEQTAPGAALTLCHTQTHISGSHWRLSDQRWCELHREATFVWEDEWNLGL